jgi:TolA-binding protein
VALASLTTGVERNGHDAGWRASLSAGNGKIASAEASQVTSETWQVGWRLPATVPPPKAGEPTAVIAKDLEPDGSPLLPFRGQARPTRMVVKEAETGGGSAPRSNGRAGASPQPVDSNDFGVELFEEEMPGGPEQRSGAGENGPARLETRGGAKGFGAEPDQGANDFTTFPKETFRAWLAEAPPRDGRWKESSEAQGGLEVDARKDGKAGEHLGGVAPLAIGSWNRRRLEDGALGALVGALVFFAFWFAGFEPPSAWRAARNAHLPALPDKNASRSDVEETAATHTSQKTPAELERLSQLAEQLFQAKESLAKNALLLEAAQQEARVAALAAADASASARARDLEDKLKATEDKLEAVESKLEEMTARLASAHETQRTAFTPPDNPPAADAALAYQSYAKGLVSYAAGRYADAEREFLAAGNSDGEDARFHYFLGLSRLALGKPAEAAENFQRGSCLERENKPSRVFVSVALERVRSEALEILNRCRPAPERETGVP